MKVFLFTCPRDDGTAYNHIYSKLSESAILQVKYYLRYHYTELEIDLAIENLMQHDWTQEIEFFNVQDKWICSFSLQEISEDE